MIFKTAIDSWFWLLVFISAALVVLIAGNALASGAIIQLLVVAITAAVAVGLPVWLAFTTRYIITDEHLLIIAGPFSWRVPRSEITRIEPTRSRQSAPALSLDRLAVHYGSDDVIVVSPKEKTVFVRALGFDADP